MTTGEVDRACPAKPPGRQLVWLLQVMRASGSSFFASVLPFHPLELVGLYVGGLDFGAADVADALRDPAELVGPLRTMTSSG